MGQRDEFREIRAELRQLRAKIQQRPIITFGAADRLPTRIVIGRGNLVYTASGAYNVYGCKAGLNPTSVSVGMWNATTKKWIPADSSWENGICYGYLSDEEVVAVATKFDGVTGQVGNDGALVEGSIIYSKSIKTYVLGSDTLKIYLVDEF